MPGPLATAGAIVLAVLAALAAWAFARRLGAAGEGGRAAATLAALVVLLAAWAALASLAERPFVALHLSLWAGCALVLCAASGRVRRGFFAANIVTSCLGASMMLAFALMGLDGGGGTLWRVNADDALRPLAVAAGFAVFVAVAFVFCRLLKRFPLVEGERRTSKALYGFSWFSLAYILLDSLPSLIRLDMSLLSFFLVGSTVLFIVSTVAFVASTSLLGGDARQQEEYLALVARRDIQEARLNELRDQAYRDALTGLISRHAGVSAVRGLLEKGCPFTVGYLDMNGLKAVNDAFGHEVGDACLVRLASALVAAFPPPATVCRMSGDEFLVVLEGKHAADFDRAARAALGALASDPLEGIGAVTFAWGVSEEAAGSQEAAAELIARADRAMYARKRAFHGGGGA